MFFVRELAEDDAEQVCSINSELYVNSEGSILNDALGNKVHPAFVAIDDTTSKVIGYAIMRSMHPQNMKLRFEILVESSHHKQGIGTQLFRALMDRAVQKYAPKVIQVRVKQEQEDAIDFFMKHGFSENHRMLKAKLRLAEANVSNCDALESNLVSEGITISTIAEEQKRGIDYLYNLYLLNNATMPDYPRDSLEPVSYQPFEQFWLRDLSYIADAFFIAKKDDLYVGMAYLFEPDCQLWNGHTAVRREHRGLGVATVLKCRTIEYAKRHSYTAIYTSYRNTNPPMKSVNEKLGWVPYSSEVRMEQTVN